MKSSIASFIFGYISAALWTEGMESRAHDLAQITTKKIYADCEKFCRDNKADLAEYCKTVSAHGNKNPEEYAGHDFWLTRNGHGAGFWDREGVAKDVGERLTNAAHAFGASDLYEGDDKKLYVS